MAYGSWDQGWVGAALSMNGFHIPGRAKRFCVFSTSYRNNLVFTECPWLFRGGSENDRLGLSDAHFIRKLPENNKKYMTKLT
jgi:hypothetical protein